MTLLRLCIVFCVALIAVPPAAHADDLDDRKKKAQDLADSGYELIQKGRYAQGCELMREADDAYHSPVFVLFIAECEEKQGNLVTARAELQRLLDEKLEEYAPKAFHDAQKEGRKRARALDERIPTLRINVDGPGAAEAVVVLDGREIEPSQRGRPMPVDPGQHKVSATGSDGVSEERDVTLEEGARESVELVLSGAILTDDDDDDDENGDAVSSEGVPSWIWPTIAYGVGGVGLIVGTAVGIAFLGKQSDLKEQCEAYPPGNPDEETCPPELESDHDTVITLGNVSTVGWVIAGVGAVVGTILVIIPIGDDDGATSAKLGLGPAGLSLSGSF